MKIHEDSLYVAGLKILGNGGDDKEYFDKSDYLADKAGNIIYHPEMEGCFSEVEIKLSDIIDLGKGQFECQGTIYEFKNYKLLKNLSNQLDVYNKLITSTMSMEDLRLRKREIIEIALAINKTGHKKEANALLKEVIKFISKIPKAGDKVQSFLDISNAMNLIGQKDDALVVFKTAIDSLSEVKEIYYLDSVVELMPQIASKKDALPLLEKILTVGKGIKDPRIASNLYRRVAALFTIYEEKETAIKLFITAWRKADEMNDADGSRVLKSYCAKAMGNVGFTFESIGYLRLLMDDFDKKIQSAPKKSNWMDGMTFYSNMLDSKLGNNIHIPIVESINLILQASEDKSYLALKMMCKEIVERLEESKISKDEQKVYLDILQLLLEKAEGLKEITDYPGNYTEVIEEISAALEKWHID